MFIYLVLCLTAALPEHRLTEAAESGEDKNITANSSPMAGSPLQTELNTSPVTATSNSTMANGTTNGEATTNATDSVIETDNRSNSTIGRAGLNSNGTSSVVPLITLEYAPSGNHSSENNNATKTTNTFNYTQNPTEDFFNGLLYKCSNDSNKTESSGNPIMYVVFYHRLQGDPIFTEKTNCTLELPGQEEKSNLAYKEELVCDVGDLPVWSLTLLLGEYNDGKRCISIVKGTLEERNSFETSGLCYKKDNSTVTDKQILTCDSGLKIPAETSWDINQRNDDDSDEKQPASDKTKDGDSSGLDAGSESGFNWPAFMFGLILGVTITTTVVVIIRKRKHASPSVQYKLSEFDGSELTLSFDDPNNASYNTAGQSQPKHLKSSEIL